MNYHLHFIFLFLYLHFFERNLKLILSIGEPLSTEYLPFFKYT